MAEADENTSSKLVARTWEDDRTDESKLKNQEECACPLPDPPDIS